MLLASILQEQVILVILAMEVVQLLPLVLVIHLIYFLMPVALVEPALVI